MAADQVLAMEVVLPKGNFVTASPSQNPDLFWALRGGGGSIYGVVTPTTVKAYPDVKVTSSNFSFKTGESITHDNFWKGIRAYFDYFIQNANAGIYAYFFVIPAGEDASSKCNHSSHPANP